MKLINRVFTNHKEFDKWAQEQNVENVFKIRLDNYNPDYWSIIIHKKEHFKDWDSDLVLLSPLEIYDYKDNKYDLVYPQMGPINWNTLEVLEEYTEDEVVKIITKNPDAKVYLRDRKE